MNGPSLRGRLLVAAPRLIDPNFFRTAVLIIDHGDHGAAGLVLNRPTNVRTGGTIPRWDRLAALPAVIFVGGPVQRDSAIALAKVGPEATLPDWRPIVDTVGIVDLRLDPDEVGTDIERLRVFSGYAGWGAGQLEAEISTGSWLVVDARPDDVLTAAPARLWHLALTRQRGRFAGLVTLPSDPSLN